jgi:uncharacterized Zn finger protein
LSASKKPDDLSKDFLKWLKEDDPFGLDEEMIILTFKCKDCGKEDGVPEYVVEEFSVDLNKGEQVEIECPFCGGTMHQASDVPSD